MQMHGVIRVGPQQIGGDNDLNSLASFSPHRRENVLCNERLIASERL
jgi:hypothetical protein